VKNIILQKIRQAIRVKGLNTAELEYSSNFIKFMKTARFLPASNSARILWGLAFFLVVYQVLFGFSPTVISWDTYGYYLYLPQTFIHDDLGIQDFSPIEGAMNGPVKSDTFFKQ
jgi:hypothetical protein